MVVVPRDPRAPEEEEKTQVVVVVTIPGLPRSPYPHPLPPSRDSPLSDQRKTSLMDLRVLRFTSSRDVVPVADPRQSPE